MFLLLILVIVLIVAGLTGRIPDTRDPAYGLGRRHDNRACDQELRAP